MGRPTNFDKFKTEVNSMLGCLNKTASDIEFEDVSKVKATAEGKSIEKKQSPTEEELEKKKILVDPEAPIPSKDSKPNEEEYKIASKKANALLKKLSEELTKEDKDIKEEEDSEKEESEGEKEDALNEDEVDEMLDYSEKEALFRLNNGKSVPLKDKVAYLMAKEAGESYAKQKQVEDATTLAEIQKQAALQGSYQGQDNLSKQAALNTLLYDPRHNPYLGQNLGQSLNF